MKNIIIIIAAVLININAYSQIKLTNKLQSNLKIVKIDENNFKSYSFNSKNNTLSLFNLDNTLWKTVALNIPDDTFLDEILDISSDKINQNPDIEIVYTTYMETYSNVFDDVETIVYENYTLFIVNELGEEILKVDGGRTFNLIKDNKSGKVFLIDVYPDEEFFPEYKKTFVYSLY